ARDVDLLAVDQEVTVAHQLAGLPPGAGDARPVDHVVQPRLEGLQQHLTGLAPLAVSFLVVATELLLQHAVAEASVLLLLPPQQGLGLLDPAATVLAGRVRTTLEGLVSADQVDLEPTRLASGGSGVTGHGVLLLPYCLRPGAAWAGGSRCGAAGSRPGFCRPRARRPAANESPSPGRNAGP